MSDIGELLRSAREEKQLSLDEAVRETSIRKSYLKAVETNDFTAIPGEVFVKGIIRTYGNFLGLDGEQLVQEYKESRGEAPVEEAGGSHLIRESAQVKVSPTFKSTRDIGSGGGGHKKTLLGLLAILLVSGSAAAGFWYYLHSPAGQAPLNGTAAVTEKAKGQSSVADHTVGKNSAETQTGKNAAGTGQTDKNSATDLTDSGMNKTALPQKPAAGTAVPAAGENRLTLTSSGRCWLRVQDNTGKILYEGTLTRDAQQSFAVQGALRVNIGNLSDLVIEHNGKVLPHEETHEPVIRTYVPDGKDTK